MDLDGRVADRLARGDAGGAATLVVTELGPAIFRYLASRLGADDAEDAFSHWAETAWTALPAFRRECALKTWAYRLAYSAISRLHRDPFRRRGTRLRTSAASRLARTVASTQRLDERRERFRRLCADLPDADHLLLALRTRRELEFDDIAAILSTGRKKVTAPALRKRYERVKRRLARRAKEEGLTDEP